MERGFETYASFLYFMFITISTVGYGDWTPTLPLTRWVCMLVILLVVTIVPATLNELGRLLASPARRIGAVPRATRPHFVIIGDIDQHALDLLLRDLYGRCKGAASSEWGAQGPPTLVLTPLPLEDYDGAAILQRYRGKVSMLRGDVLSKDLSLLQRLGLGAALGVFVIARLERESARQEEADEVALLTALALTKFCPPAAARTLVQLNCADHARMLRDPHVGIRHVRAASRPHAPPARSRCRPAALFDTSTLRAARAAACTGVLIIPAAAARARAGDRAQHDQDESAREGGCRLHGAHDAALRPFHA